MSIKAAGEGGVNVSMLLTVTHLGDRNRADLELLPWRDHLQLHLRLEGVLGNVYMVLTH